VFFATASSDGTCKVWELRGLEQSIRPRSHVTYAQQGAPLLDACIVEGSHSIATAASNGSVHVWRVELASTSSNIGSAAPHLANGGTMGGPGVGGGGGLRVAGSSLVKQVAAGEGPVLSVHHFNTDLASVVVYSTQRGRIHAWDLRCSREPWRLAAPPELGALTAVALGPDRHWVCAGTARGYLAMWDVRLPLLARLWRHSARGPIHRLSTCARLPGDTNAAAPTPEAGGAGPHVFIAAGDDETAVWDLRGAGTLRPRYCFRVAPAGFDGQQAPVPSLDSIALPAHPRAPLLPMHAAFADARLGGNAGAVSAERLRGTSSIRAIVGRISQHGNSYLITGGSDRHIRYWDFQVPSRCYTVSGGSPSPLPASMMPSVAECGVTAAPTAHEDAILDLKCTDMPLKLLLSSSRDGVVNVWR
ncbi:WD40-repeat-containing domain protein, partial [Tribonema minus]